MYAKLRFDFQRLFKALFVGVPLFDSVMTAGCEAIHRFIVDNGIGHLYDDLVLETLYARNQVTDDSKLKSYICRKESGYILTAWDINALQHRIHPGIIIKRTV